MYYRALDVNVDFDLKAEETEFLPSSEMLSSGSGKRSKLVETWLFKEIQTG